MKSAAKTPMEMGLSSVASMLAQIYDATEAGNQLLTDLRENILSYRESVVTSLSVNAKLFSSLRYYAKKNDKTQLSILKILQSSYDRIGEFFTNLFNSRVPEKPDGSNLPAIPAKNTLPELSTTNKLLAQIAASNQSRGNGLSLINVGSVNNVASQAKEKASNVKDKIDLPAIASSIVEMKKNLTTKMIKNFDKFSDAVKRMVESADEKKAKTFETSIDKISATLDLANKKVKPAALTFTFLSGALTLLSLAAISPTFGLATAALAGMLFVLQKAGTGKEMTKGLPEFAKGLVFMAGSLIMMSFVKFDAAFKLLAFIAILGLVLKSFMNDTKGNIPGSLVGFAGGIGILTLAMVAMNYVQWNSVFMMLGFIGGLGLVMLGYSKMSRGVGMPGMPGIVGFAFGIGLLTLAMLAFNEIPWQSALKMIVFIGALGITLALTNKLSKGPTAAMSGLPGFAFGLGLMVLAILAFNEIPWESIAKMLGFIGALGIELAIINKLGGGTAMKGLPGFAFGLGLMVLAMYAMNELPMEAMYKTLGFLAGLGLVMLLFKNGSGKNMLFIALGIGAIALSLWIFKKVNLSVVDAAILVGTILGVGLVMVALGALSSLILTGSLAAVGIAVSITLIGLALAAVTNLPIIYENIGSFALAVGLLAATFAVGLPFFVLGAIGAVLFLPIAISSLVAALSLAAIGALSYKNIGEFAGATIKVAAAFALVTPLALIGVIGAALFVPIAAAALLGALALMAIAKLNISEKAIGSFGTSIKSLVGTFSDLGFVTLAKTSAKAALLIPIAVSLTLVAGLFRLISGMDISEAKMLGFSNMMNLFVTSSLDVLAANGKRLKDANPGIQAIAKLASISKSLAETIQLMANMQFYEYEVRDGKLVLKNARKLTPEDMMRVGQNLAAMLNCLIEPLVLLGSDNDVFIIGGQKVSNPFKDGRAIKGMEVISQVGAAFKPLVEAIKTFTSTPIASDPKALQQFNVSLQSSIGTICLVMQRLETMKLNNAKNTIATIQSLIASYNGVNAQGLSSINDIMGKLTANLSDDAKWDKINKNLDKLKSQFKDIAKNINSIDVNKALSFERNLKNLIDGNNSKKLSEVAENLRAVIELIAESKSGNIVAQDVVNAMPGGTNATGAKKNEPSNFVEKSSKKGKGETADEAILRLLAEISTKLENIGGRMNSTFKVQQVGANGNLLSF